MLKGRVVALARALAGLLALASTAMAAQPLAKGKAVKKQKTAPIGGAITGTLSDEGVECPAMIGDDGRLYTLVGVDPKRMQPGLRVSVTGEARQVSKCMQGTTIAVKSITFLD